MVSRLLLVAALWTCVRAQGFVSRLLDEDPGEAMRSMNLQEYYGRVDQPQRGGVSKTFLTLLLSYEYATSTVRFHFNMKEPAIQNEAFLAETDMQWNTQLDLTKSEDRFMVNQAL